MPAPACQARQAAVAPRLALGPSGSTGRNCIANFQHETAAINTTTISIGGTPTRNQALRSIRTDSLGLRRLAPGDAWMGSWTGLFADRGSDGAASL